MIGLIASGIRTLLSQVEEMMQRSVPLTHNIFSWMIHHTAWAQSRFRSSSDKTTPYYRINGSHYHGAIIPFGSAVLVKMPILDQKHKSRWKRGIWVGKSEFNDTSFISTDEGIVTGRSIKSIEMTENLRLRMAALIGVPWDPKLGMNYEQATGIEQRPDAQLIDGEVEISSEEDDDNDGEGREG